METGSPKPDKGSGLFEGLSMSPTGSNGAQVQEAGNNEEETPRIANPVVDISKAPKMGEPETESGSAVSALPLNNGRGPPSNGPAADLASQHVPPPITGATLTPSPAGDNGSTNRPSNTDAVSATDAASQNNENENSTTTPPRLDHRTDKAVRNNNNNNNKKDQTTKPPSSVTRGMKVHSDTPIPNADKSLRILRKFVAKTRGTIPTQYGGAKKAGILSYFRSNPKEDPTFVPYGQLVEVLLDGDEGNDVEDDDTLESLEEEHDKNESKSKNDLDEPDLVVESIFGVSGDTMAKARLSVAAFCHLLSVWGHASSRFFEQQDTRSQQAFSELLVVGIDSAAQLVSHGCLDGVEIWNVAVAEEYMPAINILAESVLVADVTLERSELAAMKFLLSAGCRVKPGEEALLRGTHLLQTIRMLYHIYLTTESKANRTTARAALQQLVTSIFARLVRTQEAIPPPTSAAAAAAASPRDLNASASASFESKGGNGSADSPFPSENHRDAFLVLRSICKLSMRNLPGDNMHSHVGLQTSGSNTMWDDGGRDASEHNKSSHGSAEAARSNNQAHLISTSAIHPAMESKVLALELLHYVLENVKFSREFVLESGPQFHSAIRNYLCVSLLKNCTSDNAQVVHLSLRMFALLVRNFRTILKNEVEAFVTNVFFVILDSKNSPIEHKNLVVTLFEEICSDPHTLAEIFLNYDCDLSAVDLFHRIVNTLSRVARTDAQEPQTGSTISFVAGAGAARAEKMRNEQRELRLDAMRALRQILASLHASIVEPMDSDKDGAATDETAAKFPPTEITPSGSIGDESGDGMTVHPEPAKQSLVQIYDSKKKRRKEESEAVLRFNQKPSAGIKYAAECGHINADDPADIATYLQKNKDLFDKTMIGDYLGREAEYQGGMALKVLHEYARSMDFTGLQFDDAIRYYLSGFRLPGEAQKIDRIMEKFAERYTEQNPDVFPTADVAFILAFSIIMLNTDLHNPAIKEERRMTKEGFIRNNRGIADGQDLPDEFLLGIFDRIKANPISLKEDDEAREKSGDPAGGVGVPSALRPATFFGSHYDDMDRTRETNFQKERDHIVRTTESLLKRRRISTHQTGEKRSVASRAGTYGRRAQSKFVRTEDSGLRDEYVSPMFEVTWGPALAAFSVAMESANGTVGALENIATDEELELAAENAAETIEVCLTGFKFAVCTAGLCGNEVARDSYMLALSRFSQLGTSVFLEPRHIRCIQTLLSLGREDGELLGSSWEHVFKALAEINRFHQLFHLMARNDRAVASAAERRLKRLEERKKRKRVSGAQSVSDDSLRDSGSEYDDWSQSGGSLYEEELFSDDDDIFLEGEMDGKAIDEANARVVYEAVSESMIEAIYERSSSFSTNGVKEFIYELCRVSRMEIDVSGYGGHVGSDANTVDLTKVHYRQHHSLLSNNSKHGDSQFHHSQPNIYSLQKLVEVTHYNMDSRPRLVFSELWDTVSAHLTSTALHSNPAVAMYAVDSFRQLSIQFLQRGETEGFEVQRRFLKPLVTVISQSEQVSTKELLLKCVERIVFMFGCDEIEAEAGGRKRGVLRSGWVTILQILAVAGNDSDEGVARMGFEMLKEQLQNSLEIERSRGSAATTSILTEHFVDVVDALFTYIGGVHEALSLESIHQIVELSSYLGDEAIPLPALRRKTQHLATNGESSSGGHGNTSKDFEHWWPILLGLSKSMDHATIAVRSKALVELLKITEQHFLVEGKASKDETLQTMRLIFRGILTPVLEYAEMSPTINPPPLPEDFERFTTDAKPAKVGEETEAGAGWVETTFDDFIDGCVSICLKSMATLKDDALVEEIFAMLNNCMLSDSGVVAVRGLKRLHQFVVAELDPKFVTDDTWATVCHMLRSCLKVKGMPKPKDHKDSPAATNEEGGAEANGDADDDEGDIREFVMEDRILSDRRYVASNTVIIIGSLLSDERFVDAMAMQWKLFLVTGLGKSIREWGQADAIVRKYSSKIESKPAPPDYIENAMYGRKWMARLIVLLVGMKSVATERDASSESQKVVKEQTQKLLSWCVAKETEGLQKDCSKSDKVLGEASSALVLSFLANFDCMSVDRLHELEWLNPVLLSWCTRSKSESIQKAIHDLLEKTSPASPKAAARTSEESESAPAPAPARQVLSADV